ncbi:MAG: hypothetical protein EXR82_10970 [Gammaproteobacteria bacterium]|nr:hypothetical protein [Gammaproteobacteria bacterium]
MLCTTRLRLLWTFLVGYFVASNLNWGIAAFLLNPWAMPRFDGFMRVGEAAGGINIVKMVVGFLLPQFVAVLLAASLSKPSGWAGRATYASLLVGIAGFFGTYTFLSGWGNVNWVPLMAAAVADTSCLILGTLITGYLQQFGKRGHASFPQRK